MTEGFLDTDSRDGKLPHVDHLLQGDMPETAIYKKVGELELKLLVQKPAGWSSQDRRLAILWIHGGGWTSGEPERFIPHCRYMAMRGAVAFSVQYRLIGTLRDEPDRRAAAASDAAAASGALLRTGLADCLADCEDAVRFIRQHADEFGIDPTRIVAAGDSAGGHLAACLGTIDGTAGDAAGDAVAASRGRITGSAAEQSFSARVNAVVNCNGVVDLTGKWRGVIDPPYEGERDDDSVVKRWLLLREEAIKLSPLFRVKAGQPPSLTLHGLRDATVEPEQAVRYCEAHAACGNLARLVLLPESKHAFILFGYTASQEETLFALGKIDEFLSGIGMLEEAGGR